MKQALIYKISCLAAKLSSFPRMAATLDAVSNSVEAAQDWRAESDASLEARLGALTTWVRGLMDSALGRSTELSAVLTKLNRAIQSDLPPKLKAAYDEHMGDMAKVGEVFFGDHNVMLYQAKLMHMAMKYPEGIPASYLHNFHPRKDQWETLAHMLDIVSDDLGPATHTKPSMSPERAKAEQALFPCMKHEDIDVRPDVLDQKRREELAKSMRFDDMDTRSHGRRELDSLFARTASGLLMPGKFMAVDQLIRHLAH